MGTVEVANGLKEHGKPLHVDPNFLFVDEDWPLEKPLSVSICGDNIEKIRIISGNEDNRFSVFKTNQSCGSLKLTKPLDADQLHSDGTRWQSFSLLFAGLKKGQRASLDIQVVDVNDNVPKFVNWRSEVNVSEKISIGSVIQRIQTFDPDTGVGGIVRFFSNSEKFSIENERCSNSYCHAELILKSPLDYESNPVEHVTVVARDGASLTKHANEFVANLTINVIDEQDTPPAFLTTISGPIKIMENLAVGSKVLQVNAVDGDRYAPKKNEINYEIVGKSDYFQIDPVSGTVILKKNLDRETDPRITVVIMATEQDDIKMSSEMTVEFVVEDANDNPPQCSSQKYNVQLNRMTKKLNVNKPITVFDVDQGKNARFDVELNGEFSESFSVQPKKIQGTSDLQITVVDFESLEYVTDSEIILELHLVPRDDARPGSSTKCLILVELDPIAQKNIPKIFKLKQQIFKVQIMENMAAPQILANLTDPSDVDIVYTIEGPGATLFSVNEDSQFVTSEVLDAEVSRSYELTVSANKEGQMAVTKIQVAVLDENDNEPVFEKPHYIFNVTEETEATFYVKATDADSPANGEIAYSILPPVPENISVNEKTGRITVGKIDVDKLNSSKIEFRIIANDNGEPNLNSTTVVTLNIKDLNDNVPFFSKKAYSVILNCGIPLNSTVVKVKALDMDLTGSRIRYELPGEMQNYFKVDPVTGIVIFWKELPKNRRDFHFNIIARDDGRPPKQAVTRVTVRVADCVDEETNQIAEAEATPEILILTTVSTTMMESTTTWGNLIEEKALNIFQNKPFNKLDGATRVFVPKHLTADVEENSAIGTKILDLDIQNETNYEFHFSTHEADKVKFVKMNKLGELRTAENIDFEETKTINGSIFARSNKRNLLYATVTINIIDKNDNKPVFRLSKNHTIQLSAKTEIGHTLELPYPLATDQDASLDFSTIVYEMKENNSNGISCFKIDRNSSIIQLTNSLDSCSSSKIYLFIQAMDNPRGNLNERNIVNHTLIIEILDNPDSTTAISQGANLTSEIFKFVPNEISVFEDESIGSVLLVINSDEITKITTENNSISDTSKMNIELTVRNSDLVELTNGSELRLRKSLKGYVNQKICVHIEAKLDVDSMVPQLVSKSVCLAIKPRPKGPVVFFPLQNSIHKFKENTKYESLLNFNVSSTILDPKLSGLKYGIVETKNDDWKSFTIDSRGVLKSKHEFDFEKKEKYNLQIQVCDFNDSCTDVTFRIQVEDLNDHCPAFSHKFEIFEISENQPVGPEGMVIGEFRPAEDADGTSEKRSICYKIEESDSIFFLPDFRNSILFVKKSLDREEINQYNVTVIAVDCHFKERDLNCTEGNSRGSFKKLLIINVADLNDNFPKFTQKEYYGKVIERKTKFGEKILQVEAVDPDVEIKGLHYSMSSAVRTEDDVIPREEAPFHIDSKTGDIISHVVYSSKMPHSYNFRVVVRDGAEHEDEASVTISVINYNEQVELIFDQPEETISNNKREISKLMFDVTSMYFVIDDISGQGNSTNVLGHFLEKDKLLASASKALMVFEESKSEQAQKARHELRRNHGLREISSENTQPDLINTVFNSSIDGYTIMLGSIFTVIFLLLFLLITYLCCHRSTKTSGKLNCSIINQDLIYGNGTSTSGIGLHFPKNSGSGLIGTMTAQHTSTLNHPQRPQSSHQPAPGPLREDILNPPDPQMFDALQSTEL